MLKLCRGDLLAGWQWCACRIRRQWL